MYLIITIVAILLILTAFLLFLIGPSPWLIRRSYPRHRVKDLPLVIRTSALGQPKDLTVTLRKISQCGVNFISEADLPEASSFTIDFEGKTIKAELRFKGTWEKISPRAFEYGAEIVDTDEQTCKDFLNSILSGKRGSSDVGMV